MTYVRTSSSIHDEEDQEAGNRWSENLPPELLGMIASKLTFCDYASFTSVCKSWHAIGVSYPPHPASLPLLLQLPTRKSPTCQIYDPWIQKAFVLDMSGLFEEAWIEHVKDGWIDGGLQTPFLFICTESLTGCKINLPDIELPCLYKGICLSATPSTPGWMVFMIASAYPGQDDIYYWHDGDKEWSLEFHDNEHSFVATNGGHVFHDGVFYCLDEGGEAWYI